MTSETTAKTKESYAPAADRTRTPEEELKFLAALEGPAFVLREIDASDIALENVFLSSKLR